MRIRVRGVFLLLLATAIGCASYKENLKATKAIWSVTVTTKREDVKNCRHVASVDSRDAQRGCGLTVQPTTEECLRYQVLVAGGDTLLANGYVGEAYQCSAASPTPGELSATPTPSATPAARSVPSPTPAPAPLKTSPAPASGGVQLVQSRQAVKGCVYLDEIDLRSECPVEGTGTPIACIAERAARAAGNTVLVEGDRALIFSCKPKGP